MIINATGLGKDKPGSPFTWDVLPTEQHCLGVKLQRRAYFFDQAESQRNKKNLTIHDGWIYFIHGWLVIAEVFQMEIKKTVVIILKIYLK